MRRRRILRTITVAGVASVTGCLAETGSNVVLDPPTDQQFDSDDLPYPAYGQTLPEFSLPNPLSGETIGIGKLDETLLVTGFFATCPAECVQLIGQLTGVQQGTIDAGIADAVRFLAITFDPERDDAAALQEYATRMNVDLDAGNWEFLRPPDAEAAERVVDEQLGITFERVGPAESARVEGYDFTHLSLTFLVNPDGYVERAYRTSQPDAKRVLSDARTVVERTE
ncbi:SCO family protein [Haloarcula laminariae]|uniref:SCO family protein n=1 Tax=Haloarcula laminariae TaxID=2961577 RepID=UPI00240642BC|nr:SCO family protein [Halomicroarcula sp. FL173]